MPLPSDPRTPWPPHHVRGDLDDVKQAAAWDRFWSKVDVGHPLGCWEWTAARHYNGYGKFGKPGTKNNTVYAHRYAWELLIGPLGDLHVDHLCRNRPCVNPDHLDAVTQAENNRRSESAMAKQARQRECIRGHPFTDENTYHHDGHRYCVACRRERNRSPRRESFLAAS